MAKPAINLVLQQVRKWLGTSIGADSDDRALLERFVAQRDEEAFAALVDRHGPLVLGVCRQVLGDAHAAEDAFQAVFLILAQGGLDPEENVTGGVVASGGRKRCSDRPH